MLINWKKPGLLFAVCPITKTNFKILGGINEIPDESWKALAPRFKAHIEAGNLVEVEGQTTFKDVKVTDKEGMETGATKVEADVKGSKTFKSLTAKEQEKFIADTSSVEQLKEWKDSISKPDIRLAIEKRIDTILNPSEED